MFGTEHEAHEGALLAIGLSAGGLRPLRTVLRDLPSRIPGAVVIAHHVAAPSILPTLVTTWGRRAVFAAPGMRLEDDTIYVCPAAHHVIVNPDGTLEVSRRGRIDYVRPSIDWFFESVAASYAERAVAVLLSGANDDGARGARHVHACGGRVLVQDRTTCEFPAMPAAALATGSVHHELPPSLLGSAVTEELQRLAAPTIARSWQDPFGVAAFG